MTRKHRIGLPLGFSAVVLFCSLGAAAVGQAEGEMNGFSGTVTDASGNPLEGICVSAQGQAPLGPFTETDASGHYVIDNRYGGKYIVHFSPCNGLHSNLIDEYYNNKATSSSADPVFVPVEDRPVLTGIDAQLTAPGSISGTVMGDNGQPFAEPVCVVAEQGGGRRTSTQSDASGKYQFGKLPAGSYSVGFEPCGRAGKFRNPVPECYSDAPREPVRRRNECDASAAPVTVEPGKDTEGINAELAFLDSPQVMARPNRNRFKLRIPLTISADEPARVRVEGVLRVKAKGKRARDYPFKSVGTQVAPGEQRHVTLRLKSARRLCAARLKDLSGSHKGVYAFGTATFTDASGVTTAPQWKVVPKRLDADDRAKLRQGKGSC